MKYQIYQDQRRVAKKVGELKKDVDTEGPDSDILLSDER